MVLESGCKNNQGADRAMLAFADALAEATQDAAFCNFHTRSTDDHTCTYGGFAFVWLSVPNNNNCSIGIS